MLTALLVLQLVMLIVLVFLSLRRPASGDKQVDPRLEQLLGADLPGQFTRLDTRSAGLEQHLRGELAQLRNDAATEAGRSREASATAATALRTEVLASISTLGETLRDGLKDFRSDNKQQAEALRATVEGQLGALAQRFTSFTADSTRHHGESREALHTRLTELGTAQTSNQEKLRAIVEDQLSKLNQSNAAKLDEMRATVDEKLQQTLHSRLTESFGAVTDQLTKVHAGLGEMNTLTTGVNDLNRIFSNVKSRGGFAEVQLGKLLDQVLAPGQYLENANVRPGTQEVVEFAVRFPGTSGEVLLPIDAKFPREDWERLESAYEAGSSAEVETARKAFDAAIRVEGKRISSKYINEPVTTPYAIMFLPTEGLYAEVLRRDGLQADLHQNCRVMVAGPANLYALLTSFQLGFKMLNLQKKGDEVWKILAKTQNEFGKFEELMVKMDDQVSKVQKTIQAVGVRTRAINRTLRDVGEVDPGDAKVLSIEDVLPQLTANEEE